MITSAITLPNTYFIFREDSVEVKVVIDGEKVISSHYLTDEEKTYLKTNIQKSKHVLVYESIINKSNNNNAKRLCET